MREPSPAGVHVEDHDARLSLIDELGVSGSLLQALSELEAIAPLTLLRGSRARCTAAWLLEHLGDRRTALRWHVQEHRSAKERASARYFYTYALLQYRGPVEAWLALREYEPPAFTTAFERAEIVSQKARLLAYLGDHREADAIFASCDQAALGETRSVWLRSFLLEQRERRAEARELLEHTLTRYPHHRLLVQQLASLLEADDRHGDALALLEAADQALEAPVLSSQLASLNHELGRFDAELLNLARYEALSVKPSPELAREIAWRKAENAYARGQMRSAARLAHESGYEFAKRLIECLPADDGPADRKLLRLPVLLQEPMGCAPSSLAIVSSYFGFPVDQIDVADQICYEGTASHSERSWVEGRGFISREFTVDFATAQALIERDVPFLLVTVSVASAHAQVVTGFDRTRRSLLIRDPGGTRILEFDADKLFERHRAYGPRGHVMLPPALAHRLDGLVLPETELHDAAHALRLAIASNDPSAIAARMGELTRLAPEHPLTLWARRSLAFGNGDPYAILACSEALLARFPEDANAELSVLDCLANIGTRAEQEARVEKRLSDPKASWIFHERRAELLLSDGDKLEDARRSLRRAELRVPTRGRTIALRATVERDAGALDLALCLRRVAATLEPTDDDLSRAYFEEAFRQGDPEPALALLKDRVERYQGRSGEPLCVLFNALEWLDREQEAFAALEAGLAERPDDGALLLFAAHVHGRYRRNERALALLERARGKIPPDRHEQAAASLAELAGDLHTALARHEAVLAEQPFSMHSGEAVAELRSELYGLESAREQLAQACARYPTHCDLRERYIRFLRGHDPEHVLPELDALLSLQPSHGWALRERALVLSDLGRHEEAVAQAEAAALRQPNHPGSQRVLSSVRSAAGQREAAMAPARRALELMPDGSGCVTELLALAGSLREQLELMRETFALLSQKSTTGNGLFEWRDYAAGLLRADELLAMASELVQKRPGLWVSQQLLARELMLGGDAQGARAALEGATLRFAFVPRLFLDLAAACRSLGDVEGETNAVASALRIDPGWITGTLRAAECVEQQRDPTLAQHTIERGLRFHPRSVGLLSALAELAFDRGDPEAALSKARLAVECDPESGPAWASYAQYASHLDRNESVTELAEELTRKRPWNAFIWLRLAEVRQLLGENLLGIEALRQALERRPQLLDALDNYAQALTKIGKKAEALEACERALPNYFARGALRARRAWVLWEFGERDSACLEMRKVLTDHTDQIWGLQELINWEEERGQFEAAVRLAEELVVRAPLRAVSYGFLGSAKLGAEDMEGAMQALGQAAKLDPSYAFAGTRRIEHAISCARFDEAELVIAQQGPHVPANTRDFWNLSLSCAREQTTLALEIVRRIAVNPSAGPGSIASLLDPLKRLPKRALRRELAKLLRDPDTHPELGALFVSVLFGTRFAVSPFRIALIRRRHRGAFETAVRAHFEHLGETSASWLRVSLSVLVLGISARDNDEVWGKVGYALTTAGAFIMGELWLADYRTRPSAEAWMLHNYRICAIENHRTDAGLRAVEHALTLPTDLTLSLHLAFAAFGRAVNGDIEGAREILDGRSAEQLSGLEFSLFEASRLLVELSRAPHGERPELVRSLRRMTLALREAGRVTPYLSSTTLDRWFAAGVLRQHFSFRFFISRWALWIALLSTLLLMLASIALPSS